MTNWQVPMNESLRRYDELLTEVESCNEHKEPSEKLSAATFQEHPKVIISRSEAGDGHGFRRHNPENGQKGES
jgi:hypothetical protein